MTKPRDPSKEALAAGRLFRKEEAGSKAMAEYQAAAEARINNIARLRELRIAKEAAEIEAQLNAARKAKALPAAGAAKSPKKK